MCIISLIELCALETKLNIFQFTIQILELITYDHDYQRTKLHKHQTHSGTKISILLPHYSKHSNQNKIFWRFVSYIHKSLYNNNNSFFIILKKHK